MPMTPFVERSPEVGASETKSAMVMPGQDLPAGNYGFLELYCNEPGCDCRRAIIQVLRPETGWSEVWATISYGWESQEFYRSKVGDDSDERGPYLDPLNSQASTQPFFWICFEPLSVHLITSSVSKGTIGCSRTRQPKNMAGCLAWKRSALKTGGSAFVTLGVVAGILARLGLRPTILETARPPELPHSACHTPP